MQTLDELELRRERAIAKIQWFEHKALPAIAVALAAGSLLFSYWLFQRKRPPVLIRVGRSPSLVQTGLAVVSVLASFFRTKNRAYPVVTRLPSPLEGTLPDHR